MLSWEVSSSEFSIIVCIIDEGVADLRHEINAPVSLCHYTKLHLLYIYVRVPALNAIRQNVWICDHEISNDLLWGL